MLGRLWKRTEVVGECWVWRGASNARGGGKGKPRDEANRYGCIQFRGKSRQVHVVSYLLFVQEPLPDGATDVHHRCEVTLCWRPEHLEATTRRENLMASDTPARRNAEKTHCKRGHEFTPENTRMKTLRDGRSVVRACKRCELEQGNLWRQRNRDRVNAKRRIREGRARPGDEAFA
jgi:hypothetical protein